MKRGKSAASGFVLEVIIPKIPSPDRGQRRSAALLPTAKGFYDTMFSGGREAPNPREAG